MRPLAVPLHLASITPDVRIAKQSSSPSILETRSRRFGCHFVYAIPEGLIVTQCSKENGQN